MGQLKKFRKGMNLTQTEMSKIIGVSFSYYSKIESSKRSPSYEFLKKVKKAYPKISIDEIFF